MRWTLLGAAIATAVIFVAPALMDAPAPAASSPPGAVGDGPAGSGDDAQRRAREAPPPYERDVPDYGGAVHPSRVDEAWSPPPGVRVIEVEGVPIDHGNATPSGR